MDLDALLDDIFVTSGKFTKTVYRDEYPGIDPTSAALPLRGKAVLITVASQGISRHVRPLPSSQHILARSEFLLKLPGLRTSIRKAGVKALVLIAGNAVELEAIAAEVKKINLEIMVFTHAVDIRKEAEVKTLFAKVKKEFRAVDVVNNAGSAKSLLPLKDVSANDFWFDFINEAQEVNFRGTLLIT